MSHDYKKLHAALREVGFFTDLKCEAVINGFRIDRNFTFGMVPHGIHVTCAIPGYNRSKGKTTIPNVRVVEFYSDGTAWIAQPGKLDGAVQAIEGLIEQRKVRVNNGHVSTG
jgi:hypothetical protein